MKPSLRTVLRNFLNHFEDYEARKKSCDDQYEHEFQQLKKLTDQLKEDPECSCSWALKDVNRPKNRYKDIVPYDKSRVILPKCDGVPGSDYINASYIKGSSGALAYIAAQGPLPNTVMDFWRMIWVCDVQVIVMACNEKEAGKTKCETYWPNKGEIKHFGNISVELIDTSQVCPDFMVRTLLVKCESEMRDVYQFHYTSWPDHGVPETVHPMLELVRLMRDCQASETVPIVVHCSAGCGRTGTICAVDYVWACLRHGKLSEDFSLFQIALELRRQRIAMIQTKLRISAVNLEETLSCGKLHELFLKFNLEPTKSLEQYILAHKAVATLFEQQLNVIDCHIYVNLDEDGEPLMWKELSKNKFALIKKENSRAKDLSSSNNDATKDEVEQKQNSQSKDSFTEQAKKESSQKTSSVSDVESITNNKLHDNMSASQPLIGVNNKNSGSNFSQNSCLSQHSSEDPIPFIDDDDISVRPNSGRAYLNMPSSGSFSKIINRFDPFADQIVLDTDDSSPDGDPGSFPQKVSGVQSNENINGDQSSVSSSKQELSSESSDQVFPSNYATLPCGSSLNKNYGKTGNRESYPPSRSRYDDSDIIEEGDSNSKGSKKVGKATVVRRPSISKLRALFEKSGLTPSKSSSDGGKRSLFRHNSHSVSRAGSAPPSLNCMDDKTSAVEKESILMYVTRKFRSSSVRTEREVSSKYDKSQHRKSSPGSITNLREGFATLSRTVSFNISKTLRSYSPSKAREKSSVSESGSISSAAESISYGSNKSKLPEIQPKGKSTWYDKSSLPRAVAVVKPTEKLSPTPEASTADVPKSPTTKLFADKGSLPSVIPKPPKLLPFFNPLGKPNGRDTSTMWYNEVDENLSNVQSVAKNAPSADTETTKPFSKSHNIKVLPFIHSITPWKKMVSKSPLPSPESPKNLEETIPESTNTVSNSKFYTNVENANKTLELSDHNLKGEPLSCPVPEEIIPLNTVSEKNSLIDKETYDEPPKTLNESSEHSKDNPEPSQDKIMAIAKESVDVPPAIPKKMGIGKQKLLENQIFFNEHEVLPNSDGSVSDNTTVPVKRKDSGIKPPVEGKIESPSLSPKDHYINVTPKTLKNIEQIENTVCNNPRGAIIDLTSRESYCMEEELDNALKQLSESSESKTSVIKSNSKFPGYEVIWPEEKYPIDKQLLKIDSKTAIHLLKEAKDVASKHCKTGLCYSPPLRRSMKAQLGLAKCRSCSNIDWLEPKENVTTVENSKEPNTSPTKKLVNDAVVELNTLLDRLTTRTLTEDSELKPECNQIIKTAGRENEAHQKKWLGSDNIMTHSVTLFSKSNISDSSSKEEEIVFHFPPPPPLPPPEEEPSTETFNIVRKNGTIKLAGNDETKDSSTEPRYTKDSGSSTTSSVSSAEDSIQIIPQPTPRKSKQNGLRKSASYTNICVPQSKNKGYENVFLEKYQTLSRLQIEPKLDNLNQFPNVESNDSIKPLSSNKPQILKPKPDYVNVKELHISSSPKFSRNSPKRDMNKESSSALKMNTEEIKKPSKVYKVSKEPFSKYDMSKSCPPSELKAFSTVSVESDDKYSTYGKICKVSDKQLLSSEKRPQDHRFLNISIDEATKKPSPSKKTERAPLPPNNTHFIETKEIHTMQELPKKLPSRKLEKAPLPPPLLQKSFTSSNIAKKNMPNATHYANFPPYRAHISEETPVLPAVHENISNDAPASALSANLPKTDVKSNHSPVMGRGLSHSQSDASVFLALKERKMQPVNKGLKAFGNNPLLTRKVLKHKKEFVSISSSDSDSSYERIFFDKPPEQLGRAISKHINKEQITNSSPRTYRKEMPVAPPRSKRRNTTEINYAKVKSKDASPFPNASAATQDQQKHISQLLRRGCSTSEPPPAIPLKTKDAFEVPDEFGIKGNDKMGDKRLDSSTSSDVRR